MLDVVHSRVHLSRVRVLFGHILQRLPADAASVLDIGSGDGRIAEAIQQARPGCRVEGADTLVREDSRIPVTRITGPRLPFPDGAFEFGLLIDVLHHTDDPFAALADALRVCRRGVIIKDHLANTGWARQRLTFMDWVGNARHGVALPCNYWSSRAWDDAFERLGAEPVRRETDIKLYAPLLRPLFQRGLHFVALVQPAKT